MLNGDYEASTIQYDAALSEYAELKETPKSNRSTSDAVRIQFLETYLEINHYDRIN